MDWVQQLFTVYDVKAEVHFPPFVARNTSEALRTFGDLLTDPQTRLSKHPGDYRLYRVGQYHCDTGRVIGLDAGVQLVEEGLTLVREEA